MFLNHAGACGLLTVRHCSFLRIQLARHQSPLTETKNPSSFTVLRWRMRYCTSARLRVYVQHTLGLMYSEGRGEERQRRRHKPPVFLRWTHPFTHLQEPKSFSGCVFCSYSGPSTCCAEATQAACSPAPNPPLQSLRVPTPAQDRQTDTASSSLTFCSR